MPFSDELREQLAGYVESTALRLHVINEEQTRDVFVGRDYFVGNVIIMLHTWSAPSIEPDFIETYDIVVTDSDDKVISLYELDYKSDLYQCATDSKLDIKYVSRPNITIGEFRKIKRKLLLFCSDHEETYKHIPSVLNWK